MGVIVDLLSLMWRGRGQNPNPKTPEGAAECTLHYLFAAHGLARLVSEGLWP